MDIGIISARYARALLKFSAQKQETQEVYQSMNILGNSFMKMPELRAALENPVISDERKFRILNLAAGDNTCESIKQFFRLVIKNRRVTMIQFMAQSYIDSYRKQNHLIHSHLIVPVALDDQTLTRLKNLVKEKTQNEVEFVVDVDSSIIGGFIMEYDTYCFDASIRSKLNQVKKSLLSNDKFMSSN